MDFWNNKGFKAIYEDGELVEWLPPQTFRHVFKMFKYNFCTVGVLLFNNKVIRTTGPNNRAEKIIEYYGLERA